MVAWALILLLHFQNSMSTKFLIPQLFNYCKLQNSSQNYRFALNLTDSQALYFSPHLELLGFLPYSATHLIIVCLVKHFHHKPQFNDESQLSFSFLWKEIFSQRTRGFWIAWFISTWCWVNNNKTTEDFLS